MLVEAVRINFLSTLGKKKKGGNAALKRGGYQRLSQPACTPHSGELAFAGKATPRAGSLSAVLNRTLNWRVLSNERRGLKKPKNRPPHYPVPRTGEKTAL